jgi:ketosteroid isomerase-like protein
MSQENVEIVRRLNDVYNERGFAENSEVLDPEFVWDMSRMEVLESASYTGDEGFRRFFDSWSEGFVYDHVEAEEIVDAGDRVVVMVHHSGRGRTSGIDVDQRYAMVWTVRDGRAMRMDMYPTRAEALEAVGLAE